jgi:hypothetical protein
MSKKIIILLIAFVFVFSQSLLSKAKSDDDTTETVYPSVDEYYTTIGEHSFVLNSNADDPFIIHDLRVALGGAQALSPDVPLPIDVPEIIDDTLYFESSMTFLMGSIRYKHKINDWAAFSIGFYGIGRVGTSLATIIDRGVSGISGFQLAWYFKLFQTKKSIFTTSLSMNSDSYLYLNIKEFVEDLLDSTTQAPTLDKTYKSLSTVFGVSYAFGFTRFFGMMANAHLGYGELPSKDFENDVFWDASLYFDFNFINMSVPLGFNLGLKLNTYPYQVDNPLNFSRSVFFKLAYVGQTDFNVGLEANYFMIPNAEAITFDSKIIQTQFVFELYF